jgi:hypothetical protein
VGNKIYLSRLLFPIVAKRNNCSYPYCYARRISPTFASTLDRRISTLNGLLNSACTITLYGASRGRRALPACRFAGMGHRTPRCASCGCSVFHKKAFQTRRQTYKGLTRQQQQRRRGNAACGRDGVYGMPVSVNRVVEALCTVINVSRYDGRCTHVRSPGHILGAPSPHLTLSVCKNSTCQGMISRCCAVVCEGQAQGGRA